MNGSDPSFRILHRQPGNPLETRWRACLADSDVAMHYTAPEYFLEPSLRGKKPFAVLGLSGEDVTAVLTGIWQRDRVQSGLSVRPQIVFSRHLDRTRAMRSLIAGLLQEAESATLVDLFVWSDMARFIDARFHQTRCEGVVILDLTRGPEVLFREFSETRRRNIRRAIRSGVSVDVATSYDDVSAYYAVYIGWARRKALPIVEEEEFQETFTLQENRRLFLARHGGQVIAGVVVRFFADGMMEYAANSSLENGLHLRPNDLLHWRAIEWAYSQGLTKYSLGGAHLFLRKFGGEIVPTTRCCLDQTLFRRYAIGDWITARVQDARPFIPERMVALGRSLRRRLGSAGAPASRRSR